MVQLENRDEPPFDRLGLHARALFLNVLMNGQPPIAMVGSGVSIIYGNISWQRSVEQALEYAAERIDNLLNGNTQAISLEISKSERSQLSLLRA